MKIWISERICQLLVASSSKRENNTWIKDQLTWSKSEDQQSSQTMVHPNSNTQKTSTNRNSKQAKTLFIMVTYNSTRKWKIKNNHSYKVRSMMPKWKMHLFQMMIITLDLSALSLVEQSHMWVSQTKERSAWIRRLIDPFDHHMVNVIVSSSHLSTGSSNKLIISWHRKLESKKIWRQRVSTLTLWIWEMEELKQTSRLLTQHSQVSE